MQKMKNRKDNKKKKKHLTKWDIALILEEILYDVVDLAYGECEDPILVAHDINYAFNVIMEQIDKYYIEIEDENI